MSGILSHTPAFILRTRLIDAGNATDPPLNRTWPVYVDGEPTTPDNVITIRDTSSSDKGYNQPLKQWQEHYGVQVRVRAKDVPTGYVKFNALKVAIEQYIRDTVTIGSVTYVMTSYVVSESFLNRQPSMSRLPLWTINAMIDIKQTSP